MRITTIDEIPEGYERIIMNPPDGDMTNDHIRAAEMLVKYYPDINTRIFRARFVPEPKEIVDLQSGAPVWLSLWGAVVPFNVQVGVLVD